MPTFTRSRAVWFTIIVIVVSCSGSVLWIVYGVKGLPPGLNLAASLVPILGSLATTIWFARWNTRLRRQAVAADGRLCWECGYVLKGLPDRGECPECGTDYDAEDLRRRWLAGTAPPWRKPPAG